jgi:glycosyltransferase involved in cell wall biosynthesis
VKSLIASKPLAALVPLKKWVSIGGKPETVTSPSLPLTPYPYSLSLVLPAYNEWENIAETLYAALNILPSLVQDFEIIVVNDHSNDETGVIAEAIASMTGSIRVLHHATNRGCGAALATGFAVASKEYSFYMDSDGQFDISDLCIMLPELHEYDGVFGYRIDRKDTFARKLNALLWNIIIRFIFNLKIHDIDCGFKIFRTEYFKRVKLEAEGALMLTELVYKFARAGYSYAEVGVQHYPRVKGRPTGANMSVIVRAFKELLYYTQKWGIEEQIEKENAL